MEMAKLATMMTWDRRNAMGLMSCSRSIGICVIRPSADWTPQAACWSEGPCQA